MELAPSCLCFFILQLSANIKATAENQPTEPHGLVAEIFGFPGTHLFSSGSAGEQLLFQENPLEVTRAVNNFAQFALN